MSKLSLLRKAIALRLRQGSNLTVHAMKRASACIAHLQLHGCVVHQVTVRRDHVTIDIDQPSNWLQGAAHIVRVQGNRRTVIKVTTVLGCQVNWSEHEDHPLLRREG